MAKRVGCGDRSADRNGEANADWSMKEIAGASKQRDSGGTSTNVPLLLASNRVRHQTQLLLATGTGFHCLGTRPVWFGASVNGGPPLDGRVRTALRACG